MWVCTLCTFEHTVECQQTWLTCGLCGSPRVDAAAAAPGIVQAMTVQGVDALDRELAQSIFLQDANASQAVAQGVVVTVKDICPECNEPVLASHRRMKNDAGTYVHYACTSYGSTKSKNKPRSGHPPTLQCDTTPTLHYPTTPTAQVTSSTGGLASSSIGIKDMGPCQECQEPVLASHRRIKCEGGYVHYECSAHSRGHTPPLASLSPEGSPERNPPDCIRLEVRDIGRTILVSNNMPLSKLTDKIMEDWPLGCPQPCGGCTMVVLKKEEDVQVIEGASSPTSKQVGAFEGRGLALTVESAGLSNLDMVRLVPELPHPWQLAEDEEGKVYYYNSHTKKYTIELPEAGYGDLPHFDEL